MGIGDFKVAGESWLRLASLCGNFSQVAYLYQSLSGYPRSSELNFFSLRETRIGSSLSPFRELSLPGHRRGRQETVGTKSGNSLGSFDSVFVLELG